jgi:hypothetical protein
MKQIQEESASFAVPHKMLQKVLELLEESSTSETILPKPTLPASTQPAEAHPSEILRATLETLLSAGQTPSWTTYPANEAGKASGMPKSTAEASPISTAAALTIFELQTPAYVHMKPPPGAHDDWKPPYAFIPDKKSTWSIPAWFAKDAVQPSSAQEMDYPTGPEAYVLQHDKPLVYPNKLHDPVLAEMLGSIHVTTR